MPPHLSIDDVLSAGDRIRPHIHRTPLLTSATLDAEVGATVVFKCENLQKIGAFKARGALNAVLQLDDSAATRGVVTHSSGNHGQALAYAAAIRDIPCRVVMPDNAQAVKVDAVRGYGAEVVFCDQMEREEACARVQAETGATVVHPFDDARVIAGQGTAALELIEDEPGLDVIVTPIGGGGLLAGTAVAARARLPDAELVGAEPEEADDSYRSLATGVRQPRVAGANTIADGLVTGIGQLTFDVLQWAGARVVTVSEEQIVAAGRFHLERMKIVVEPSGATALAAVRKMTTAIAGLRVGVIISGGNTDLAWLSA